MGLSVLEVIAEHGFGAGEVFGGVHTEAAEGLIGAPGLDDADTHAVLQPAQLLQRLHGFQGGDGQLGQAQERGFAVGVKPHVLKDFVGDLLAGIGDERSGEIEGVAVGIENHLHDVHG